PLTPQRRGRLGRGSQAEVLGGDARVLRREGLSPARTHAPHPARREGGRETRRATRSGSFAAPGGKRSAGWAGPHTAQEARVSAARGAVPGPVPCRARPPPPREMPVPVPVPTAGGGRGRVDPLRGAAAQQRGRRVTAPEEAHAYAERTRCRPPRQAFRFALAESRASRRSKPEPRLHVDVAGREGRRKSLAAG
ncbi:hypothetical protein JHW43_009649, partial [Diplocarpon mali]